MRIERDGLKLATEVEPSFGEQRNPKAPVEEWVFPARRPGRKQGAKRWSHSQRRGRSVQETDKAGGAAPIRLFSQETRLP